MKTKLLTLTAIAASLFANTLTAGILPYDDFLDLDIVDSLVASTVKDSQGAVIFQGGMTGVLDVSGNTADAPEYYGSKYDKLGFAPEFFKVTNVALAFSFYKWVDQSTRTWAQVDIDLNLGDAGLVSQGAAGSLGSGSFPGDPYSFSFLIATTPLSGPTSLSEEVAVKLIADVQADGMINWGIDVGTSEGVYLYAAVLGVEAHRVPDSGSTMAFLGAGIFGLVVIRRRLN